MVICKLPGLICAFHAAGSLGNDLQARLPDLCATFLANAITAVSYAFQGGGDATDRLGGFITNGIEYLVIFPLLGLLGGITRVLADAPGAMWMNGLLKPAVAVIGPGELIEGCS